MMSLKLWGLKLWGQILQYKKRDSRIYWRAYTTVSRVIKRIEGKDEK